MRGRGRTAKSRRARRAPAPASDNGRVASEYPRYGYIEGYCQDSGCAVREVRVHIKDIDATLPQVPPKCPFCGGALTVHWARTQDEHNRIEDARAIGIVNAQLHQRQNGAGWVHVGAF